MPFAAGCAGSQGMERGSADADVAACPTRRFNPRGADPVTTGRPWGTARRSDARYLTHQLLIVSVFEIVNIAFRKLGVGTADAIFQIS